MNAMAILAIVCTSYFYYFTILKFLFCNIF